ncbi:dephospho-CoA kinase [Crenothrix polyspora]|uniref:Dephospho-CoA kinase n=1 Tax=Crenothrix polyspora TaxID=360316 RepID=A0A1R4HCA7_9GAMM|nr:dephospho-CoA kinase [Crenothrix polyspora]SJM93875.1 dephospho-CoA kinase [Crenothrix polyspora]
MLKIGLTGGIGCGKTTVSQLFMAYNIPVIDADEIAHQLVEPGQPALEGIKKAFGIDFVTVEGMLDRKKMRDCIFSDNHAKQQLEAILHPLVYSAVQSKLTQLNTPYCVICVPLLFETKMEAIADRILVVDCPVAQQIERVRKRENMPDEKIQAIIDSQIARDIRLSKADDVINNAETENSLAQQVEKLHHFYISLSTL